DRLPCLGCHTLNGKGGTLAPELSTVSQRRAPEYVARMVADPQATVPGTAMPHTPMPAEWRALVIRYLGGAASQNAGSSRTAAVETGGPALRPVSTPPRDTAGAVLYARFCASCHGAGGKGDGPN